MVNAFFNANDYLAKNKDLVAAGLHTPEQLWEHYVTYGAQENAEGNADREPNSWFDVNYYLGNYPDLVAAGITAGQALNHYFEYGINEGRSFDPVINASQFDAETYAEKNPDVREYYGIAEDAELTAADKANLLKHYLSYGYAEDREGAGEISYFVEAKNEVYVGLLGAQGTIADDLFDVYNPLDDDAIIDGLGGNDTVVFNFSNQVFTNDGDAVILRNIENVEVDDVTVTANVISQLNSLTLNGAAAAATLIFDEAAVAASNDVLNATVKGGIELNVNGFETVNLDFGNKFDGVFALDADKAVGSSQTVNLSGGDSKGNGVELTFDNVGSTKLTDLTIDGSALAAGLGTVTLEGEALFIKNVTVKGSADAENTFDIGVGDQALTVIGGNEGDTFNAVEAIETLTGGRGNDTFSFTAVSAITTSKTADGKTTLTGIDTVTDFKKGDVLKVGSEINVLELPTGGEAGLNTLEKWVEKALDAGDGTAFNYDGAGYVIVGGADLTDVSLVKLVGVDVAKLDGDLIDGYGL